MQRAPAAISSTRQAMVASQLWWHSAMHHHSGPRLLLDVSSVVSPTTAIIYSRHAPGRLASSSKLSTHTTTPSGRPPGSFPDRRSGGSAPGGRPAHQAGAWGSAPVSLALQELLPWRRRTPGNRLQPSTRTQERRVLQSREATGPLYSQQMW